MVGPLISTSEADRLAQWLDEAIVAGATPLLPGGRQGNVILPQLLTDVPESARLCAEEAFGPVAVLSAYTSYDTALATVNRSRYGLQAGVFTRDIHRIEKAWSVLEVGGVIVNDVPSWRADHMPYGGVKDSGLGREGIRYAIEDMTERRLLAVRRAPASTD